jgi:hypothetical protein
MFSKWSFYQQLVLVLRTISFSTNVSPLHYPATNSARLARYRLKKFKLQSHPDRKFPVEIYKV